MRRSFAITAICLGAIALGAIAPVWRSGVSASADAAQAGVVSLRSRFGFDETVSRLKANAAVKGILFFSEIDQSQLAANAGIKLAPSTLLVFGNPPLGTLFISANPLAGLDWPVRLLVFEKGGDVWVAYTNFTTIARRHGITNRDTEFNMASQVIGSLTSAVDAR